MITTLIPVVILIRHRSMYRESFGQKVQSVVCSHLSIQIISLIFIIRASQQVAQRVVDNTIVSVFKYSQFAVNNARCKIRSCLISSGKHIFHTVSRPRTSIQLVRQTQLDTQIICYLKIKIRPDIVPVIFKFIVYVGHNIRIFIQTFLIEISQ